MSIVPAKTNTWKRLGKALRCGFEKAVALENPFSVTQLSPAAPQRDGAFY